MNRTTLFIQGIMVLLVIAAVLLLHGRSARLTWSSGDLSGSRQVIKHLQLTDFALWTEARYTRNPALADYFTPFQDYPASFEHFPAGSIISPKKPTVETTLQILRSSSK